MQKKLQVLCSSDVIAQTVLYVHGYKLRPSTFPLQKHSKLD